MVTRVLGFVYGVVCYFVFFGTFLYAIGFVGGGNLYGEGKPLIVPRSIDLTPTGHSESLALRLRSEEHTSELQSHVNLVCRLLLEKKKKNNKMLTDRNMKKDRRNMH